MPIDRRKFVTIGAGALLTSRYSHDLRADENSSVPRMLKPRPDSGFATRALMTTGDSINGYRPPGIMDGMAAWDWDSETVRLFVNHELGSKQGYIWTLENGTAMRGARISWFDIDKNNREIRAAGPAIKEIRDRRGEVVTRTAQINEEWDKKSERGLTTLCSAQGYRKNEFGFVDDLMFTHEEVSAREDHPHGGSVWALDVRAGRLWALPELGRGSWENVTAIETPDQDNEDGHIALLIGDDLEFGGAPLYIWVGRKNPDGDFLARNGLSQGQLHVWKPTNGDRTPEDWHGTGTSNDGMFVAIQARDADKAGKPGYDRDGYLNDLELRKRADKLGAFMLSRPEDLHTNPANGTQAVLCSTGHGREYPSDDWGTIYLIDVRFDTRANDLSPAAAVTILHDCDDFGDLGIRSADNVVWASDGMIYIHEDKATKRGDFGGETGRESSTWRIDPENPDDREVIAVIDRSVVLPEDARDKRADQLGAWECCGLLDVSAQFGAVNELLMITAVQAHWIRGGELGGADDLFQGGQLIMLSKQIRQT